MSERIRTVDMSDPAVVLDCYRKLNVAYKELKAENEKLRAALMEIVEYKYVVNVTEAIAAALSDEWSHHKSDNLDVFVEQQAAEILRLRAEVEKLRKALQPFVFGDATLKEILYRDMPDDQTGTVTVSLGHLRAAAAALKEDANE